LPRVRYKYQTKEFGTTDIHVRTLRDKQQFHDKDDIAKDLGISSATWSLFGVVWPSSEVLAHFIYEYNTKNKRILELGCGIGLSSLILNHLNADITATDYHPEVEQYLLKNTQLNHDQMVPFVRTDWKDEENGLDSYDLIIGSDVLYESNHAELLSNFINKHANEGCEVFIVDPGRGNRSNFTKKMGAYGFKCTSFKPKHTDYLEEPYKGNIFKYSKIKKEKYVNNTN
jgi:predicted nicotinamide N-methyase